MALLGTSATLLLWLAVSCSSVMAFAPPLTTSSFQGSSLVVRTPRQHPSSTTSLSMFLGNDGGLLGVGAPEVVTILLVGYFVLGPSDLYKLTKEIGKGIQNFRTLSSDVTKTFENNMESQLQLEELRKAQRELTDAFSFRRSINVDEEAEAFATTPDRSSSTNTATERTDTSTDAPKPKKKRRRLKKKIEPEPAIVEEANGTVESTVPDLEMPAPWDVDEPTEEDRRRTEEELALREARMERLKTSATQTEETTFQYRETPAQEQDRFAQQLSGNWNEQILANSDKLEPLAKVMERLAILEEEKNAADARLEEEFRLRAELEEKYYKEKRAILEEAAAEVQSGVYASVEAGGEEKETAAAGEEKKTV